jgi:hypothetical protein
MGFGKSTLVVIAIVVFNVFLASVVGLMMGGLAGAVGGMLVGLCISAPMVPWPK